MIDVTLNHSQGCDNKEASEDKIDLRIELEFLYAVLNGGVIMNRDHCQPYDLRFNLQVKDHHEDLLLAFLPISPAGPT